MTDNPLYYVAWCDDDEKVILILAANDYGGDDGEDESMTLFRTGET